MNETKRLGQCTCRSERVTLAGGGAVGGGGAVAVETGRVRGTAGGSC